MPQDDASFVPHKALHLAVEQLLEAPAQTDFSLPPELPETGLGESEALKQLAHPVLQQGARLDLDTTLAHMDPPTPWITWAMALWNARMNQNLLHPSTAPFAQQAEQTVLDWLCPLYGMQCGQFTAGSTLANLSGLWAARDAGGVKRIVVSEAAHISIDKAARILGLELIKIRLNTNGQIDTTALPDLSEACLVLIAGSTNSGSIDPLPALAGQARWTHVDAAWGGPLRLSRTYSHRLDGIEKADSIAISAHKWFFQPKDSALILYRQPERVSEALSFAAGYLAQANFGLQGSRGAAALPLLATFMAWGRSGMAERIERMMQVAEYLAEKLEQLPDIELWQKPSAGVVLFRPLHQEAETLLQKLPETTLSSCVHLGQTWLRLVAANPSVQPDKILQLIQAALRP